jgi:hypothetical protein
VRGRYAAPGVVMAGLAVAWIAACAAHPVDAVVLPATGDAGSTSSGSSGSSGGGDAGATYIWPNSVSQANSDPWIAQHHDQIAQMQPRVLVLDFANRFQPETGALVGAGYDIQQVVAPIVQQHVDAIAVASQYLGYRSPTATQFLRYQVAKIVDLRDRSGQVNSMILPVSNNGTVDYAQLNTQAFADRIGIQDPAKPGTNLTLCGLFEKGLVNEVWGMTADPPTTNDPASVKFAEFVETKQAYTIDDQPNPGTLACTSPQCIDRTVPCTVTTRFYDFNPGRGPGCQLFVMGTVWESYLAKNVLPAFARAARTFFNYDFDQRFGAPYSSFYGFCLPSAPDAGPCIRWPSTTHAVSGPASTRTFDFSPMSAGCGNVGFPPNATGAAAQDDGLTVLTSCENYGLRNAADGGDLTTPYTTSLPTSDYSGVAGVSSPDCSGPQVTYLFASMPGLGTTASLPDGTPMKNWWPYLFY